MTVENLEIKVKATGVTPAAKKLTTLADAIDRVEKSAGTVGGSAGTNAAKGVEKVGKAAEKANKPLGNLLSSLKRIAFYRIIRGIIKSITQAFSEGLEKAYLFSEGISEVGGHRFADAMDRMKSSANAMKGQLGSVFISLLTAIMPLIIQLIQLITKAADVIAQFFAAFTGTNYLKAIEAPAKWADNAGGAAKAAKEWKNQLLGFDEINRLNEPSSRSGGTTGIDPNDLFEDSPINPKILEYVNELKLRLDEIGKKAGETWSAFKQWWDDPTFENFINLFQHFSGLVTEVSTLITGLAFDTLLIPLADFMDKIGQTFGMDLSLGKNMREFKEDILGLMNSIQAFIENPSLETFSGVCQSLVNIIDTLTHTIGDIEFSKLILLGKAIDWFGSLFGKEWHVADTIRGWKEAFDEFDLLTWSNETLVPAIEDIRKSIEDFVKKIKKTWDDLKTWWDGLSLGPINIPTPHFEWTYEEASGLLADAMRFVGLPTVIPHLNIGWYAHGGFPEQGSLYFAGERGPELVGTMGNQNAVANQDQIVEGIRQGVFDAVSSALAQQNSDDRPIRIYLDSREIKAGQQRLNRAWGV